MVTAKKVTTQNSSSATKALKKPVALKTAKKSIKKSAVKKSVSKKVDYYPNRMTFWVSAAAGSIITLVAIICVYNR